MTDQITAVARTRFQRFGYAKTSMKEIADDCGMSPANLYRYFDGKPAIAAAVALAEQKAQLAECDAAVRSARANVADRLIVLFTTIIDSSRRRMKQRPLLFALALEVARETPVHRLRFLAEIETRIFALLREDGAKSNAVGMESLRTHARLILTAGATFVLPWMLLNEPFGNPRPKVAAMIRCLLSGLNTQSCLSGHGAGSVRHRAHQGSV